MDEQASKQAMSETKHTPGPWRVVEREGMARSQYGDHITADYYSKPGTSSGQDAICDVKGPHRDANARLIAAAPDLLAALRAMIDAHDCREAGERMDEECPRRTAALAAIAKAEGRE